MTSLLSGRADRCVNKFRLFFSFLFFIFIARYPLIMRRALTVRLRFIMFPRVSERTEYFITVYDTFRICFRTEQNSCIYGATKRQFLQEDFHISIIYMVFYSTTRTAILICNSVVVAGLELPMDRRNWVLELNGYGWMYRSITF